MIKLKQIMIFSFVALVALLVACSGDTLRDGDDFDNGLEIQVLNVKTSGADSSQVGLKGRVLVGGDIYVSGETHLFYFYYSDATKILAAELGDVVQVDCNDDGRCFDPVVLR